MRCTIQFPLSQAQIESINVNGGDVTDIQFASDVNLTSALEWYKDTYTEHGCYSAFDPTKTRFLRDSRIT